MKLISGETLDTFGKIGVDVIVNDRISNLEQFYITLKTLIRCLAEVGWMFYFPHGEFSFPLLILDDPCLAVFKLTRSLLVPPPGWHSSTR